MTISVIALAFGCPAAGGAAHGYEGGDARVRGSVLESTPRWAIRAAGVTGSTPGRNPAGRGSNPRQPTCSAARRALRFYTRREAELRAKMGAGSKPAEADRGTPKQAQCPQLRRAALRAQARARAARARWERFRTLKDFPVKPGANAWLRAVEEAQRPYPGTRSWLVSCSASEGGHGRWVLNGHGAGGWLQFLSGTFWRMWGTARADVARRGFRVPSSAASWQSPLGQALAGAWGYVNGRRHEWFGSGC